MKKLFLSFIVLFAGLQVMQAQDLKVKEEGKTEFNSHWFMQLQGGVGHTVGRPGFSDLLTPAAAVNLGYKFNKAFALRFGASGLQAILNLILSLFTGRDYDTDGEFTGTMTTDHPSKKGEVVTPHWLGDYPIYGSPTQLSDGASYPARLPHRNRKRSEYTGCGP